jgi:hypothetical protein
MVDKAWETGVGVWNNDTFSEVCNCKLSNLRHSPISIELLLLEAIICRTPGLGTMSTTVRQTSLVVVRPRGIAGGCRHASFK